MAFLRFPPFPQPADGTTIVPFAGFKERGIKKYCGAQNPEVDMLGIPTVAIGGPKWDRDMDVCKTRSLFQDHVGPKFVRAKPAQMSREWYKEWEASEADRHAYTSFDATISPQDRLMDAAQAFYKSRRDAWPAVENKTSILDMWMQFQLFSGIRYEPPIWERTDQPKQHDESDEDDEPRPQPQRRVVHHTPYAIWGPPPQLDSDDAVRALCAAAHRRRFARLERFVADPACGAAAFLSAYMADQAFVLYRHLLDGTPQLLRFFFVFVLREGVFREPGLRAGFERAVGVAERAFVELPATGAIAHALPDGFGKGCREAFPVAPADPVDALDELMRGGAVLAEDIDPDSWGPADGWEGAPTGSWDQETDYLAKALGELATEFSSSHARGPAERSMRRIASVLGPDASLLGGRVSRVVLSPWPDYHPHDAADPMGERIYNRPEGDLACADEDITILVEPSAAAKLVVGMGIGGRWVQLDGAGQAAGYWFVEEMKKCIPGYYTAC
ncbi:hypothetical protein HDZ31DRAFT_84617 [Schizophyllum fasciatum]